MSLQSIRSPQPDAAHIHAGTIDKAGPPILTLTAPANGSSKDCATLERDKILDIIKNPANYYVNVHNADFRMVR